MCQITADVPVSDIIIGLTLVIVIIGLNREDVNAQSADETMQHCVMLLRVLDGTVMRWRPIADWPSIGAFQAASTDHPCDNYRPVNSV